MNTTSGLLIYKLTEDNGHVRLELRLLHAGGPARGFVVTVDKASDAYSVATPAPPPAPSAPLLPAKHERRRRVMRSGAPLRRKAT